MISHVPDRDDIRNAIAIYDRVEALQGHSCGLRAIESTSREHGNVIDVCSGCETAIGLSTAVECQHLELWWQILGRHGFAKEERPTL